MKLRLRNGSTFLILPLLLLAQCTAQREVSQTNPSDLELRASLLQTYSHADIVAHVKIIRAEIADTLFADDGTPGYFLNSVRADVVRSFKGTYEAGSRITYTFESDFDGVSDVQWAPGHEWIVFLVHAGDLEHELRCSEMPCQVQATEDASQFLAELQGASP